MYNRNERENNFRTCGDFMYELVWDDGSGTCSAGITGYTGKAGNLVIPQNLDGYGVSTIFDCCKGLVEVTIPQWISEIGDFAFAGCSHLKRVNFPEKKWIPIHIGEYAFSHCSSLTQVTIPNNSSMGYHLFWNCTSLAKVDLPEGMEEIGDGMFEGCGSLTQIAIPDSVTTIGKAAFRGCNSLTQIKIPTSVTTIADEAFCDCNSLMRITIPDGVTEIGLWAFDYSDSLTLLVTSGSYAETWCKEYDMRYELIT